MIRQPQTTRALYCSSLAHHSARSRLSRKGAVVSISPPTPTRECARSHFSSTHSLTHTSPLAPQDGYTLERVDVYGLVDGDGDGAHETVVISSAECYVARNDNPSFSASRHSTPPPFLSSLFPRLNARRQVGSEPLGTLADVIWHAVGPSGPNKVTIVGTCRAELRTSDDGNARQDYVYQLAAAVRALAPEAYDSHLFALEVRIHLQTFPHLLAPQPATWFEWNDWSC